jgi:hypothetical protein
MVDASKSLIFDSIDSMSDLSLSKLMSPTPDLQAKRDEVKKVLSKLREAEEILFEAGRKSV